MKEREREREREQGKAGLQNCPAGFERAPVPFCSGLPGPYQ